MSYPTIILVTPQLAENIGFVARIMANFGFSDLRLVNPRDGWPSSKALEVSAHGKQVIHNARIYNKLEEALIGIDELYACSARIRKMNKKHYYLKEHIAEIDSNSGNKIGIMFGSERCGLLNEEIILAKKIINIPTDEACPILNLSHAVGLVCYEYFNSEGIGIGKRSSNKETHQSKYRKKATGIKELNFFLSDLKAKLEDTQYFKNEPRKIKLFQAITNIYSRADLSGQEVKTLIGISKFLYEKFDQKSAKKRKEK